MSLPNDYLKYPKRGYGMDHDRYAWSTLPSRRQVLWPNKARVALWVVPALEWFPLDMKPAPFLAPGGLARPYPDYWNYSTRDYGNRIGVFRVMRVLDDLGIPATVPMNSALAARHPSLVDEINQRNWEIVAHGVDMSAVHSGEMEANKEESLVAESVSTLRRLSGQAVTGWLSPARSESLATPDIVANNGIQYLCDWANDDLPYRFNTATGSLHAMPHAHELDDRLILTQFHHSEDSFCQQIIDQFDTLYREAEVGGGRILALSLHPWVIGQPFRIASLRKALTHIMSHDAVWPARGQEIVSAFAGSTKSE